MATDTANILVGPATVSVGVWVTAGGAGALTDVGHTKGPVTVSHSYEDFEVKSERAFGTLKRVPQDMGVQIKVPMLEATLEHYRVLTRQPTANLSGVAPDLTLRVGDPAEQYHQITIASVGVGTTLARTVTCWRAIVAEVGEISLGKGDSVSFDVTFQLAYDDSVTTADKFYKVVDA